MRAGRDSGRCSPTGSHGRDDGRGLVTSIVDVAAGREAIDRAPGNLLQLHPDLPEQVGRLGRRQVLPAQVRDLRDVTASRLVERSKGVRGRSSARLRRLHGGSDVTLAPGEAGGRRGPDRLARGGDVPQVVVPVRSTPSAPRRRRSSGTSSGRRTPTRRGSSPSSRPPPTGSSMSPRRATARRS